MKSTLLEKEELSANELSLLMQEYTVIVVDVRSKEEYNGYHIKGAINAPIATIDKDFFTKNITVQPNHLVIVVTYCNAGNRGGRSFRLLKSLNNNPCILVKNLTHGINEWINCNYPINEPN